MLSSMMISVLLCSVGAVPLRKSFAVPFNAINDAPICNASAMPVNASNQTCYGLQQAFMPSEDRCRNACCALGMESGTCDTYQWCPNTTKGCAAGPAVGTAGPGTCWIGMSNASDSTDPN